MAFVRCHLFRLISDNLTNRGGRRTLNDAVGNPISRGLAADRDEILIQNVGRGRQLSFESGEVRLALDPLGEPGDGTGKGKTGTPCGVR